MKKIMDKFSLWMNAITFAEAGEWKTARQMMPPAEKSRARLSSMERTFMAVTFAEEGLHSEAIEIINAQKEMNHFADVMEGLGLKGIRMTYGVLSLKSIS